MNVSDVFNMDAFAAAPLLHDPYDFLIIDQFVKPDALTNINADYPKIDDAGSLPLAGLKFGPNFQAMVDALNSEEFRQAFEKKFSLDLSGRPSTITVRGRCGTRDGNIHTDSTSKIITVLLYLNTNWENQGGRLRLLRSGNNLEDFAAEVPPMGGALLAFLRSDKSWHGHLPFIGERRVIQFNWVKGEANKQMAMIRHGISGAIKKMLGKVKGGKANAETENASNY
jgi:SM-20-related protein